MDNGLVKDPADLIAPELEFQNRGLFSDHFLQARLPKMKEFQIGMELDDFRSKLLALFKSTETILSKLNEAQTEKEFIQPVLELLGYANSYIVQTPTSTGVPDYALYPNEHTKKSAYKTLSENDYSQCIGIADAKYWERELDISKHSKRDTFTNKNPSSQIIQYLNGTGKKWGIVTNGRYWRLYSRESRVPTGNYYQVDIVKLLNDPIENLKYFYLFFRKDALILQTNGENFLDSVLGESKEYAAELENNIKDRAFEVVQLICRGFATHFSPQDLDKLILKNIYDNSLTFLYRLLFVFYAEARDLLPLTSSQSYCDNYSIRSITKKIDEAIAKKQPFSSKSSLYYQNLTNLFSLIDTGDKTLGIPEYNGGLFDPSEHPFLIQHVISDEYLVPAIRHLARIRDSKLGYEVAVDYNTLSERHLGSVYEGLLEFKPAIAMENLVIVKDKNSIKYASASQYPDKEIISQKNDLYLVNDKGERKTTGSYYTPEYIVDYIVTNTLDPLLKEASEKVKSIKPQIDSDISKWQKQKVQNQDSEPTEKYDRAINKEREKLLEPYLSLKILDPSMGSGHFLTRATDYLAEAIATDPWIESLSDLDEESETVYYRRRVVESCIYGVDLNPLAVELAKLTLWLSTMAKSKPLSFLNHHLKVGNSLIGAKVTDLDEILRIPTKKKRKLATTKTPLQAGQFEWVFNQKLIVLLKNRALIAQLPTETLDDIHDKQEWENSFEENVNRFRVLADLRLSAFFDNVVEWEDYNNLALNLQIPQSNWEDLLKKECIQRAITIRNEKHFFHWELEFPEVFYNENGAHKEHGGFDVILGNPPYDVISEKEQNTEVDTDKNYYKSRSYFEPALGGKLNYYKLFCAQSTYLTRQGGNHGFIVPMALIGDAQAETLRKHLLTTTQIIAIEAFPQKDDPNERVFKEAKLPTCIYILKKTQNANPFLLRIHSGKLIWDGSPQVAISKTDIELLDPLGLSIPSMPGTTVEHIKLAIAVAKRCWGHKFKEIANSQQGEVNLSTHSEFLSDAPVGPIVLRGANVDRYEFHIVAKQGAPVYLKVDEFLQGKRQDSKAFDFPETRIGYQRGSAIDNWRRIIACIIEPNHFCSDTINYIVKPKYNLYFVLGLLNSNLYEWRFRLTSSNNHINSYEIDSLPLCSISFDTPKKERMAIFEENKKIYQEYLESKKDDVILDSVSKRLFKIVDNTINQSDTVHDLLAYLSEGITQLNREKQKITTHFLEWLENEVVKSPISDLNNKTAIQNYHENAFDDLLDILKKNKIIDDPCPSKIRDVIFKEFSQSVNFTDKIKSSIQLTDSLINKIVYQLYGLNEREIEIVEVINGNKKLTHRFTVTDRVEGEKLK